MPTPDDIMMQKEKLYETSAIRNDLNDAEAKKLLSWGETQIDRIANEFPDTFTDQTESLQRLMRLINGFVGKRAEIDDATTQKYIDKISELVTSLGWDGISSEYLFADLPDDKNDMATTLGTILMKLDRPLMSDTQPDSVPMPVAGVDAGDFVPSDTTGSTLDTLHEDVTDGIAPPADETTTSNLDETIYSDDNSPPASDESTWRDEFMQEDDNDNSFD